MIPRRRMEYQGIVLEELDLDAILTRRPTVVLVDELAHTNALRVGIRKDTRISENCSTVALMFTQQ